ncbi:NUDIX hydrolase [Nocardiopsis potens]|uniref:NUDIX hydrolase n=1 Tax=Nocardiopsis potens TaxID=1246458 RepID=UPI00034B6C76|nr:NUDIX domain-containing protein [Nocardiopsis potens]
MERSSADGGRDLVEKALAYIVHDGRILVFRHVDAAPEEVGLQVPGGTVRPAETPSDAVLREAREETGLSALELVGKVGEARYDLAPYRAEVQLRHVFHLRPAGPVPDRWESWEMHDGTAPPTRFECFWIPLADGHVLQSGQGALLGRLHDALTG